MYTPLRIDPAQALANPDRANVVAACPELADHPSIVEIPAGELLERPRRHPGEPKPPTPCRLVHAPSGRPAPTGERVPVIGVPREGAYTFGRTSMLPFRSRVSKASWA